MNNWTVEEMLEENIKCEQEMIREALEEESYREEAERIAGVKAGIKRKERIDEAVRAGYDPRECIHWID